jgi:hypothetical protein
VDDEITIRHAQGKKVITASVDGTAQIWDVGKLDEPKLIVPLENLEMSERKGIISPRSSLGMLFPQPDHEGQTVGGPG